jgi:hypothetical protein
MLLHRMARSFMQQIQPTISFMFLQENNWCPGQFIKV